MFSTDLNKAAVVELKLQVLFYVSIIINYICIIEWNRTQFDSIFYFAYYIHVARNFVKVYNFGYIFGNFFKVANFEIPP